MKVQYKGGNMVPGGQLEMSPLKIQAFFSCICTCENGSTYEDTVCENPFSLPRLDAVNFTKLLYRREVVYKKHIMNSYTSPIKSISFTLKYRIFKAYNSTIDLTAMESVTYANVDSDNDYLEIDQHYEDIVEDGIIFGDGLTGAL